MTKTEWSASISAYATAESKRIEFLKQFRNLRLMDGPLTNDSLALPRQQMVQHQLRARGISDERVLAAMGRVPRHEFVDDAFREQAYADHPIPIGESQTVSQPYIVALTVAALALKESDRVLEVGAGSGYQTAILAELCQMVYAVERHASLAQMAKNTLSRLGYRNITMIVGDGSQGFPEGGPYDAIAVSAAAPEIPQPLLDQLSDGGRMVLPVGPPEAQRLELGQKHEGRLVIKVLEGCRFVPLIGAYGYAPPEKTHGKGDLK